HSGGTRAGDCGHFVTGKFALGQDGQHLAPDIPGGAYYSYTITHSMISLPERSGSSAEFSDRRNRKGRPGSPARAPLAISLGREASALLAGALIAPFGDACTFTCAAAQVIELGPPHDTATD